MFAALVLCKRFQDIHAIDVNAIWLWFNVSGSSTISLAKLQAGTPSLDTLSRNLAMFEVILSVKNQSDKVGNS